MSRFKQILDTKLRTLKVTDTETDGTLEIKQNIPFSYFDNIGEGDVDRFVEFANDLADDLSKGTIALELYGENVIEFNNEDFPILTGGIYLKNCILSNPRLINVHLTNFDASCADELIVSFTTAEHFEWVHGSKLHLSHCFINERYSEVPDRMTIQLCEWHLNQRVDGEMW